MADNATIVRDFLQALAVPDVATARSLIAPDIVWRNTGAPAVKGHRVSKVLGLLDKSWLGFGVEFEKVTAEGDQVVTLRRDFLYGGPLRQAIDVEGHFTVRDGKITVWDDRFSYLQLIRTTRLGRRAQA